MNRPIVEKEYRNIRLHNGQERVVLRCPHGGLCHIVDFRKECDKWYNLVTVYDARIKRIRDEVEEKDNE